MPPQEKLRQKSHKLIDVADCFVCVVLNFPVEYGFISSGIMTINVADIIIFANPHIFSLLKEFFVAEITDRPSEVVESNAWPRVKESNSMLAEIVETFFAKNPASNIKIT